MPCQCIFKSHLCGFVSYARQLTLSFKIWNLEGCLCCHLTKQLSVNAMTEPHKHYNSMSERSAVSWVLRTKRSCSYKDEQSKAPHSNGPSNSSGILRHLPGPVLLLKANLNKLSQGCVLIAVHYVGRLKEDGSVFIDTFKEEGPSKLIAGRGMPGHYPSGSKWLSLRSFELCFQQ